MQCTSRAALECVAPVAAASSLGVEHLMTVAFLFVATAASLLMSPRSHPRARIPMASANPELSKFLTDAEAFLEATGIGEDGEATEADRRGRPPKANKKAKRAPKASKVAKQRVGCYGCGADLQMDVLGAAGYVEPERYEVKAVHRQLKQLLCRRCRALSQGEILPAVVEGRLKAAVPTRPPELELPTPDDGDATDDDANVSSKSSTDAATDEALGMGIGVTTPEELRAELAPLRDQKVLAVLLVDVSDVTGTFLPRVRDLIGGNPIILVGTKARNLARSPPIPVASPISPMPPPSMAPLLTVAGAHCVCVRTVCVCVVRSTCYPRAQVQTRCSRGCTRGSRPASTSSTRTSSRRVMATASPKRLRPSYGSVRGGTLSSWVPPMWAVAHALAHAPPARATETLGSSLTHCCVPIVCWAGGQVTLPWGIHGERPRRARQAAAHLLGHTGHDSTHNWDRLLRWWLDAL